MEQHLLAYFVGIFIVFASHINTLLNVVPTDMKTHSYINLVAAMLIAFYFLNKEQYIKF